MKFYELPSEIKAAITNTDIRPYVRIVFEYKEEYQYIPNKDILSCVISTYKSIDGGIATFGEIELDNTTGIYTAESNEEHAPWLGIQIWYCFGDNDNSFYRFHLFVDSNGFQNQETGFLNKKTVIKLVDLSYKLNDTKFESTWENAESHINKFVCNPNDVENSIVHIISKKAGIESSDIQVDSINFNLPYVLTKGTVWQELCELASTYDAYLECNKDKTICFIDSPYRNGIVNEDESSYFLTEHEITHYRFFNDFENYANTIKIRYTHYEQTERQKLWEYSDAPVWKDENDREYFPFTDDNRKIIKDSNYEALYTAKNSVGKVRNVIYADQIDTEEQFLENMETTDDKKFSITKYDITSFSDRAIIQLSRNAELIALYSAVINGRAIVSDVNYTIVKEDTEEIKKLGRITKTISSKYLSDDLFENEKFSERRAQDYLNESKNSKCGYYITTFLPLVHARINSVIDIRLREDGKVKKVKITDLTFRYKKEEAFSTEIWVKNAE